MLKLSLALTLFGSVAASIVDNLPPTEKTEKFSATLSKINTVHSKITSTQHNQITALIQFIRNRENNDSSIPTPTIPAPTIIEIEIET